MKKIEGRIVGDDSYFDSARTVSVVETRHERVLRAPLGAEPERGHRPRRPLREQPAAFCGQRVDCLLGTAAASPSAAARFGRQAPRRPPRCSYSDRSAPLSAILAAMNKPSDNFFAEMLTKGLGAAFDGAGSTAAGRGRARFPGLGGHRAAELRAVRWLGAELRRPRDGARHHQLLTACLGAPTGRFSGARCLWLASTAPWPGACAARRPGQPARQDRDLGGRQQPVGLRDSAPMATGSYSRCS